MYVILCITYNIVVSMEQEHELHNTMFFLRSYYDKHVDYRCDYVTPYHTLSLQNLYNYDHKCVMYFVIKLDTIDSVFVMSLYTIE